MYATSLYLLVCLTYLSLLVNAAISGYTFVDGQTRLLGSSFGVPGVNATFDYVIVGGGTAGLTIATRLTENPNLSVAVIEAGGFYELDNGNVSQIPAYAGRYSGFDPATVQPSVDWGILTKPQTQLNDREFLYVQGRCLGGSSARNILAYHRGTVSSYQQWADTVGDQSYTFENLLPFFQKSARLGPPDLTKRGPESDVIYDKSAFTTDGGPLRVSYVNFVQPFSRFVRKAFSSLGLQLINGFNSGNLIGFSELTLSIDPEAATRSSSETSYLQKALARSNLVVYQRTLAKRVIFNDTNTAVGVPVDTFGKPYTLSAGKEIILTTGAFRSPQMLMVSGIGPSATLQRLGIPVRADVPGVGQGLEDQPFFGISYRVNVSTQTELTVNKTAAAQATRDYLDNRSGRLSGGGTNWIGWEKLPPAYRSHFSDQTQSDLSRFPDDWPETEILPTASTFAPTTDNANYASIMIATLTNTSRGNVTINSTNTSDNPIVDPQWLATTTDQELAVQSFRRAREIGVATGITVGNEFAPGPKVETDEDILAYLRKSVVSIHHAAATCKMGKRGDSNAVVDTKGLVFGVQNLRVADISIFPLLPPGHPQATVYAVAEKIAAEILRTV